MPSLSSVPTLSTCSLLVSAFLGEIVQHIHSLRAGGVRFSQAANASGSEAKASRKSAGTSCTTPLEISLLVRSSIVTPSLFSSSVIANATYSQHSPRYTVMEHVDVPAVLNLALIWQLDPCLAFPRGSPAPGGP